MSQRQLLGGRYKFIKVLGSDPQGHTYLVSDNQQPENSRCVVKRLKLPSKNPRTLKFLLLLLKKKAGSLQKIGKHDQIPQILSFFEENQVFYLVEEFIPGLSLADDLIPGHAWSETQVTQLLQEVLEILVVVHSWGLIHRCLKPSNLIRRQADGSWVLTGFGVFKQIRAEILRSQGPYTNGSDNGAAAYVPDEPVESQKPFHLDLYALGMIGIQALTGLSAVELHGLQQSRTPHQPHLPWHHLAQVSPELTAILDKMVHFNAEQRYQLAAEVQQDLQSYQVNLGQNHLAQIFAEVPVTVLTPADAPPGSPHGKRRLWPVGLMAGAIALLAGAWFTRLPQTLLAVHLLRQGQEYGQQGSEDQAIARYTQAIQNSPSDAAYYNRGLAHYRLGNYQAALDDLTQAIQLDPNNASSYYARANMRLELGDQQGAIADYTESIQRDGTAASAYVNRGSARADLGDDEGAINDYSQALQIDPTLVPAYLNRCLSRSNVEEHQQAIADCTQAINLQPNSVLAYQNRGLVRRRIGELTGAIADFNIAIRLDPSDADPYYNRGLAREELGDQQGAIADYTAAIEHNKNHPFAYYDRGLVRVRVGEETGAIADLEQSAKLCLDAGRMGCYNDAQYYLNQLQPTPPPSP